MFYFIFAAIIFIALAAAFIAGSVGLAWVLRMVHKEIGYQYFVPAVIAIAVAAIVALRLVGFI